uniref:TMC domain-containing protein n=1 Tax=Caenorhabditis tropicalis TaxID=1561998 RepID=A0A1I7T5K4_9PELO
MQEAARRASLRKDQTPTNEKFADLSKQDSLGERASSKLTLDDELYDILYAFGETDAFINKGDKQRETDEDGNPLTRQALLERIRQKKETLADSVANEGRYNRTKTRKQIPTNEKIHADELAVVWHYDGYLRYSALFYGYYSDDPFLGNKIKYALPLAYFMVTLTIFAYSFFAILRKMAANARMSKLSGSKAEQYIFNWKLFTGWDYTIGNSETASNTVMAVVIKLRESIADIKKDSHGKFRLLQFTLRVFANIVICAMLGFSIYCIIFAVQKSQVQDDGNLFTKNQVPSVVSTITHVFPMIFDLIGRMENYHPRTALRAHLGRVLILYTVNYITLIFALFEKMTALRERVNSTSSSTSHRTKRQQGGWNPNIQRPPPYASRAEVRQMSQFLAANTRRFQTITQRTTRSVTTPFTVAPQYGPFNVNNPNAVVHNGTHSTSFESQILGPKVLPIFTPPPRKYQNFSPGNVGPQYGGPDFPKNQVYTKSTPLPRVRTKPPWVYTTTHPPLIQNRSNNSKTALSTSKPIVLDSESYALNTNQTIQMSEAALRRNHDGVNNDICWETIIGQEIVKLVTMDLIFTILSILVIDFLRGLWIKYCSSWWCWDIETTFPEYGEFKVAENVLHIINNQGMIWLGLFFAPLLPAINNIKLIILMYIRGWAVMTCNVPAREIFRASRSSNFYLGILLIWLLLCTLPVGFVIASMSPSRSCGPFARYEHFYTVVTREIEKRVDQTVLSYIRHIASPGVVIPIILFLILIIYFLFSLVRGLREANTDLQAQLVHERTEEKKKIFELAGGKKNKFDKDRDKKKSNDYIPLIEQRRREPWRQYHEEADNGLASDSSEESDLGEDEEDERQPLAAYPLKSIETPPETLQVTAFHPSLGSLIENREMEDEESESAEQLPMIHKSVSFQGPSNMLMRQSISTESCSQISRSAIQVATPEEIRALLRPYLEAKYGVPYQHGMKSFPIDVHTPPNNTPSRRSSKYNSFVSLYEHTRDDHKNFVASTIKEIELEEEPMKHDIKKQSSSKNVAPEFMPWPSADEAKALREKMKLKAPLMLTRTAIEEKSKEGGAKAEGDFRPPVPIHRKYNIQTMEEEKEKETDSMPESSKKRFRISVSPTKTVLPSSTSRAQHKIVSQASSSSSIPHGRQPSSQNKKISLVLSPRAPRVQFDEDDSPRQID